MEEQHKKEILNVSLTKEGNKYVPNVKVNTEEYDEYTLINALLEIVQSQIKEDLMDEAKLVLFGEEPENDENDDDEE